MLEAGLIQGSQLKTSVNVYARRIARVASCLGVFACGDGSHTDAQGMSAAGKMAVSGEVKMTGSTAGRSAAESGGSGAAGSGGTSSGSTSAGRTGGDRAGTGGSGGQTTSMTSGGMMSGGASGTPGDGAAGSSMATGGAGGRPSAAGGSGGGGAPGTPSTERFSFFMTSQAGLEKLANNPKGFGGDLRFGKADGISGADEICKQLAETTMPGNGKTWRAFLSATKGPNGMPVHAIDRIGEGPWYDRVGRVFAMNKAALMSARPQGADPLIANDFPNEEGVPNHNPGTGIIDNHNTLTGSDTAGRLHTQGLMGTCQDWTSSAMDGGKPRCGVSWPRAQLTHWISTLNEGGCAPGSTPPGAEAGPQGTVGALGGYGGFYCFALTP